MKSILQFTIVVFGALLISVSNLVYGNEIFKSLTIDNGLAHTDANCIAQDRSGLMWIGTYAGLQSYDGYALRTFNYYQGKHKIYQSHNRINAVVSDIDKLWVGTESGLTCFDLNTHRYMPYHIKGGDGHFQLDGFVNMLFFHPSNQQLWISHQHGISVAEIRNDTLRLLKWDNTAWNLCRYVDNLQIHGKYVWALSGSQLVRLGMKNGRIQVLDNYKTSDLLGDSESMQTIFSTTQYLYIRSAKGCYRLPFDGDRLKSGKAVYIDFHAANAHIPERTSGKIVVHKNDVLWCAYLGGFIEIQHPFSANPIVRNHSENTNGSDFTKQRITNLLIDRYNNLWITMNSWGVFYRTLSNYFFKNISSLNFQEMGFLRNEVNAVVEQQGEVLWMLVEFGSLFRYDLRTETLSLIPISGINLEFRLLQTLCLSKNQRHLYIGTNQGTIIYDTKTGAAKEFVVLPSTDSKRLNASISKITEDNQGRLWIGTWGEGLFCIEHASTKPTLVSYFNVHTKNPVLSNLIGDIHVQDNSIFVCTVNGLNKISLSAATGSIEGVASYQANAELNASMSTNYLVSLDCQNDSICWVGTIGGGLNKVVIHSGAPNDYTATCYTSQDGLTGNDCEIVFMDNDDNVWIGGNGITRLNTKNGRIYTYNSTNGLQSNAFKVGVGCKAQNGTIYMGGLRGLSYFDPLQTLQTANRMELVFTSLTVNSEDVIPLNRYNDKIILETILDKTSELYLTHKQDNFTISFAALGSELSEQVMYRYRMKGFEDQWQNLRYTTNQISYSNLLYGKYELEIQLSNDKGYTWQTPGRSLSITVLPPWWLTTWAKLAYILLALGLVFLAMYQYNKEQNLKRENEIQKIIMVKDEEKYQAKMQFFMNASHELKTPLTLILLSAEQLLTQSLVAKECRAIFTNAKKMLALITELVDIRKIDLGINTLNLSTVNVAQLTKQLFDEISPWAEKKNISISYLPAEKEIEMDADKDKIGKLIINLFTNAIKYTSEGGSVEISLREGYLKDVAPCYSIMHAEGKIEAEQLACILTVKDTGVGISQESIRLIYERFFQVKQEDTSHLGSGIGLAIAKGVVLQHKGSIIVSSERMVGSEFIVVLPILREHTSREVTDNETFNARNFIDEQYSEYLPQEQPDVKKERRDANDRQAAGTDLPTLLIVEDNRELQMALEEHLSVYYHILIADNGRIGLEMCETHYPDIIISDVMMPEMDGIEMCRRIKNNLSIAYIPIVMLTAKANVESQIEGYESGADLYLPKPFSLKLLEVNLHRLLIQREQWFKGDKLSEPLRIEKKRMSSADEKFEARLKEVIDQHIDDPDFSIDGILEPLGMSRSKLYKKVKEVCNQPLSDYIRNMRMEKAANLLADSDMNVTEAMSEAGFVNISHFSKIFKLKYGVSPTEYKKNGGLDK